MICKLSEIAEINPKESLSKGVIARKIAMDILQPFCRDIHGYTYEEYNGGTKFRNGDTIMARITPCLENGKTAQVRILNDNEIAFGSTEYIVFRAKQGISNPDFLYYLVCSQVVREPAIKSMVGSSGRQRVQTDVVANLKINLPELPVQCHIASILSTLDEKIEINNKINDNLEQQMATLFSHMFVEAETKNWRIGTISDLGNVVGGSTPSKAKPEYYTEHGIAWITPKDLSNDKSKFISHGENDITDLGLKNSSAVTMPAGTVLFSSRAPIGYIAIADGEVTTNQGFKSVIPKPEIGTPFVYYFLKHNLPTIEGMASGSTFKEVSGSTMKAVPAVIPTQNLITEFNNFCMPLFRQQRCLELENRQLAQVRDSLLPRLMSGEIDVSSVQLGC